MLLLKDSKLTLRNKMQLLKNYWKSLLIFVFIFYVTIIQTTHTPKVFIVPHQDKIFHFVLFFIFTFFLLKDYSSSKAVFQKKWRTSILIGISILYGGIIELIQGYILTYRTADWLDFLANSIGTISAFFLFKLWKQRNN